MWEKRATSAEGKTIRIAESSDMDSWEELLRPCAKFCKLWTVLRKLMWRGCFIPVPNELVRGCDGVGTMIWDMVGYRRSFGEIAKMMSS